MWLIKLNSCGTYVIPDRGPEEMYTTGVCLLQALGALEGQGDVNNKTWIPENDLPPYDLCKENFFQTCTNQ